MVDEKTRELSLERLFEMEEEMLCEIESNLSQMRAVLDGNNE